MVFLATCHLGLCFPLPSVCWLIFPPCLTSDLVMSALAICEPKWLFIVHPSWIIKLINHSCFADVFKVQRPHKLWAREPYRSWRWRQGRAVGLANCCPPYPCLGFDRKHHGKKIYVIFFLPSIPAFYRSYNSSSDEQQTNKNWRINWNSWMQKLRLKEKCGCGQIKWINESPF